MSGLGPHTKMSSALVPAHSDLGMRTPASSPPPVRALSRGPEYPPSPGPQPSLLRAAHAGGGAGRESGSLADSTDVCKASKISSRQSQ